MMESLDVPALISRWIHIGSAIVFVGGAVFLRYVLMPSAESLPQAEHDALKARVMGRWKLFVHALITLLVISGVYNFNARMQLAPKTWHILAGIKILIALFVMFVASALVGRSRSLEPIRKNAKVWLAVNIALAASIVIISGILKSLPNKPAGAAAVSNVKAEPGADPKTAR